MQSTLALNDRRPRPRLYSSAVIDGAVESFLLDHEISLKLSDFAASDEEWLREHFSTIASRATEEDPWAMATDFAKKMDDTITEEYVSLFEDYLAHLSSHRDAVLRDWVATGGAENPLAGGNVFRVAAKTTEGLKLGIAFNDRKRAETGHCTFLADEQRASSISEDGTITRLRILDWETLTSVEEPSEKDLAIYEADRDAREYNSALANEARRKAAALRSRAQLLADNRATHEDRSTIKPWLEGLTLEETARLTNALLDSIAETLLNSDAPPD